MIIGGLCGLCGNSGMLDTRKTAISPSGASAGGIQFCICPRGRFLRESEGTKANSDAVPERTLIEKLSEKVVGLSKAEAISLLSKHDLFYRVVCTDNVEHEVKTDHRTNRLNLTIYDGKVVGCSIY